MPLTPEQQARENIDRMLEEAGWIIQDKNQINPSAGLGIVVREYPTDTGPADSSPSTSSQKFVRR